MASQGPRWLYTLGRCAVFMLETFPVALVASTLLGILAGLGLGGGSLLLLWLTSVLSMDYAAARTLNLLFFLPAAGITCLFRIHKGSLPLRKILPSILAGCLLAGTFSYIGRNMELSILRKLFGAFLIATGLRELFYRPRKAR